jgi:hypothetical protein
VLSQKRHQVLVPNAPMTSRRSEGLQAFLFDPIDDRTRIDVQQSAEVVSRVDTLDR